MTNASKENILGKNIAILLESGIRLEEDVIHYIDSTFSNPGIESFCRILSAHSDCETETLMELIFYPDLDHQEKLEPLLMADCFSEAEVEAAIFYLSNKKITVPVMFPDRRGRCEIRPTESAIRQFVLRLKIDKAINSRLAGSISRCIADMADQLRLRVLLRNCRIRLSVPVCDFLCRCMEKMYAASPRFWEVLVFLLGFFEGCKPEADIYESLMREKKMILRSIDQAEKNETALRHQSVEALMLKGMNILSIDIADARRKTVLIDHICISVFGKTELFGLADQVHTRVNPKNFVSPES